MTISTWNWKAILDTGASYTLIHEELWKLLEPSKSLHPWTAGPLYLVNGEAENPLGWINVAITLENTEIAV